MNAVTVEVDDASGIRDAGSTAAVTITSTPPGINATVQGVGGVAKFANLVPSAAGTYTLTATATGLKAATSNTFIVASSAYIISGHVLYDNGSPVVGADIQINGVDYKVDAEGSYKSNPLPAGGPYTVLLVDIGPASFGVSYTVKGNVTLQHLSANQTVDLTVTIQTFWVSGRVTLAGETLPGVVVTATGGQNASTVVDQNGYYYLMLLPYKSYTISAALPGYTFNGPVAIPNLDSGQTVSFIATPIPKTP
jgi:hypothetical protein